MPARLGGGSDVALILDCASADQGVPMRGTGGREEGGWDQQEVGTGMTERLVQSGETKIVTCRKADVAEWGVVSHDELVAGQGVDVLGDVAMRKMGVE